MRFSSSALTAAPYRLFFLVGVSMAVITMMAWGIFLLARLTGTFLVLVVPPAWAHGGAMLFVCMPFFVMGFTLTATPNWLGEKTPMAREYLSGWGAMTVGAIAFFPALFSHVEMAAGALIVHGLGWAVLTGHAWRLVRQSHHPGKRHFYIAIAVIVCGIVAEAIYVFGIVQTDGEAVRVAFAAALWLFYLPTFFSISHRVIPFFTRLAGDRFPAYQPLWMLPMMTFLCLSLFVLDVMRWTSWRWPAELALAAVAGLLLFRWRSWHWLTHPLVGVHHQALCWLLLALLLYAAQSLGVSLGLAPLHAILAGYFGTMLLGMSARVTVAHGSGPLEFPKALRWGFGLYALAPLARVAADGFDSSWGLAGILQIIAAVLWVVAWLIWIAVVAPRLFDASRA